MGLTLVISHYLPLYLIILHIHIYKIIYSYPHDIPSLYFRLLQWPAADPWIQGLAGHPEAQRLDPSRWDRKSSVDSTKNMIHTYYTYTIYSIIYIHIHNIYIYTHNIYIYVYIYMYNIYLCHIYTYWKNFKRDIMYTSYTSTFVQW